MLRTVGLMTVCALIVFALIRSAPCRAQSQAQERSANIPALEYDVASIKRNSFPPGTNLAGRIGTSDNPDGLTARFVTIKQIIQRAYGAESYQVSGGPDWINSERYDLDAKFDSSTADELQKLSPNDRILVRQQMLQKLLAERFNLTVHKDSKELQTYSLIVAKNGPKLQEVKLDDADPSKPKAGPAPGSAQMTAGALGGQIRGFASPLASLTGMLTNYLHRPVIDRTGLTERYDFTLRWTPDDNQAQVSSSASGLPSADPTGSPSIFTAIQEQLGLKLESAKAPVEIIVIDHIDRPSEN
jgi:uncharacterized protein (TIGR03435 family)